MKIYHPDDIIKDRYQILDILGQGGIAITYRALDKATNTEVAIKTISLRGIGDWKNIELFQREAQILQQLAHSSIPRYIDYFEIDTPADRFFHLVQQLAPGKSLDRLIESGWNPSEIEVRNIAIAILEILIYLQQFNPPIIHRDLKPQNIIVCENDRVFLVDFGAVAEVYQHTFNSTVVGTFGYMPPEQYLGKATLASDIYGLGATLIFLLTKKHPVELPQHHLQFSFRSQTKINPSFADWLDRCIAPNFRERFQNAGEALSALQGKIYLRTKPKIQTLKGSPLRIINNQQELKIIIPPVWHRSLYSVIFSTLPWFWFGGLLFILLVILGNLNILIIFYIIFLQNEPFLLFIFIAVVISIYFIWFYPYEIFEETQLLINKSELKKKHDSEFKIITYDPSRVKLRKYKLLFLNKYLSSCIIYGNPRNRKISPFLTRRENEWLTREINFFLLNLGNK